MTRSVKFELGDLVQLNKFWDRRIGIVKADGNAWYVLKGHYAIANCICEPKDVVKVLVKGAVAKKFLKYVR
jgi:hypothetical protein